MIFLTPSTPLSDEALTALARHVADSYTLPSQASQEWARRLLPVLDGSSLQAMRARVAAALEQAFEKGKSAK